METATTDLDAQIAKDAAALQALQPHIRRANAEPLPGPLARAFTVDELKELGFTIRPVVASDFILLKKLDSPLHRQTFAIAEHIRKIKAKEIAEDAPLPETQYDDDECIEMIYQFTRPISEVRQTLKRGRDHFREAALATITDRLSITRWNDVPRLVVAVVENFTAAFSTAIEYDVVEKDESKAVFTTPAQATATASAGGLITSPGSVAEIPPKKNS